MGTGEGSHLKVNHLEFSLETCTILKKIVSSFLRNEDRVSDDKNRCGWEFIPNAHCGNRERKLVKIRFSS